MGTTLTVTPWGWGRRSRYYNSAGTGDTCCGSTAVIILYFTIFKAFKLILTLNSNLDEIDECGRQNFVVRPSPVFSSKLRRKTLRHAQGTENRALKVLGTTCRRRVGNGESIPLPSRLGGRSPADYGVGGVS